MRAFHDGLAVFGDIHHRAWLLCDGVGVYVDRTRRGSCAFVRIRLRDVCCSPPNVGLLLWGGVAVFV